MRTVGIDITVTRGSQLGQRYKNSLLLDAAVTMLSVPWIVGNANSIRLGHGKKSYHCVLALARDFLRSDRRDPSHFATASAYASLLDFGEISPARSGGNGDGTSDKVHIADATRNGCFQYLPSFSPLAIRI